MKTKKKVSTKEKVCMYASEWVGPETGPETGHEAAKILSMQFLRKSFRSLKSRVGYLANTCTEQSNM